MYHHITNCFGERNHWRLLCLESCQASESKQALDWKRDETGKRAAPAVLQRRGCSEKRALSWMCFVDLVDVLQGGHKCFGRFETVQAKHVFKLSVCSHILLIHWHGSNWDYSMFYNQDIDCQLCIGYSSDKDHWQWFTSWMSPTLCVDIFWIKQQNRLSLYM